MLFDIIRDFFVVHVWGGITSTGVNYAPVIGKVRYFGGVSSDQFTYYTNNFYVNIGDNYLGSNCMPLGDWLSTTSAIITLVIILTFIGIFIHWCFKLVSGLIMLRR